MLARIYVNVRVRHLDQVGITMYKNGLLSESNLVPSAPYLARLMVQELQLLGTSKILSRNVIEPVQTKWAALIVFATKRKGFFSFYVDCRILISPA